MACGADSVLVGYLLQGPFVECDGGQWCLYNFSKNKLGYHDCAACKSKVKGDAEISKTVARKLPYTAEKPMPFCYPCITGFLAPRCGVDIPEAQRYDAPCSGTLCVEAVAAVTNYRAGLEDLLPFTRKEFADSVKVKYNVADADMTVPDIPRAMSPPPGFPCEPALTLADLNSTLQNIEAALVTRVDEAELRILDALASLESRVHDLEKTLTKIEKDNRANASSWWTKG